MIGMNALLDAEVHKSSLVIVHMIAFSHVSMDFRVEGFGLGFSAVSIDLRKNGHDP